MTREIERAEKGQKPGFLRQAWVLYKEQSCDVENSDQHEVSPEPQQSSISRAPATQTRGTATNGRHWAPLRSAASEYQGTSSSRLDMVDTARNLETIACGQHWDFTFSTKLITDWLECLYIDHQGNELMRKYCGARFWHCTRLSK